MTRFYLVVLDESGVEVEDIIHSPGKIIQFIKDYERKADAIKKTHRKNSKRE